MPTDTVKSTPEAREAISRMLLQITGGLTDAITAFKNDGEIVNNPENYEGTAAAGFRSEWPNVKASLDSAITKLTELADNVQAVNNNIQAAGGNE